MLVPSLMLVPAQGHSDGDVHYACVWRSCVCEWCTVHVPPPLKFCNEHRTTWPELSVSAEIEATPDHICGHSTGCQSSNKLCARQRHWRSRCCRHQQQDICVIWSARFCTDSTVIQCPLLSAARTWTVFARRAFCIVAAHTWNSQPSDIRSYWTVQIFILCRTLTRYINFIIIMCSSANWSNLYFFVLPYEETYNSFMNVAQDSFLVYSALYFCTFCVYGRHKN